MSYILGGNSYESIYPHWDGDMQELNEKCNNQLHDIYGNNPPEFAVRRLNDELSKICENNFSGFYLMMQDLIDKLGVMPHEFFTRGTAGNSFVAFLLGISGEINPLPAHYRCSDRHYSEISDDPVVKFGCELPEKNCPICGKKLIRDGFSLHQYMFTTDKGDGRPDFDLNVPKRFTQRPLEWMGNLKGIAASVPVINESLEKDGITEKITGYILVPDHVMDNPGIKEFLYKYKGRSVTGREYYEKYDELPKADILYHPHCDMLSKMAETKDIDVTKISLSDEKVKDMLRHLYDIPASEARLLWNPYSAEKETDESVPYGITMMIDTGVSCFSDVVKVFGLMYGTDVYHGNTKDLLDGAVTDINGVICDRDDVLWNCMDHGIDEETSFRIAESVRKGKGINPSFSDVMLNCGIPQWYLDSCNKIKYLLPKAHDISYVLQMWRLLYLM